LSETVHNDSSKILVLSTLRSMQNADTSWTTSQSSVSFSLKTGLV